MVEDTVCTVDEMVADNRPYSSTTISSTVEYQTPKPSRTSSRTFRRTGSLPNLNPASDGMTDSPRLPLELFAAWLANGDVGLSSLAIVQRLTGITMTVNGTREHGCEDTPKDPGDLRRILGMFDMVPVARAYLSLMRDVSDDWKTIIDHWSELEKQYRKEEHNPSGCAPKTYRMLKRLKEGNHA